MVLYQKKIVLIFAFFLIFPLFAAEKKPEDFSFMRKVTDGTLNFSTFDLTVTGSGIPETNVTNLNSARIMAEKAALANAKLKTVKILSSLLLSGKTSVEAYFTEKGDPNFVERLVSLADFKEVTHERFYSNSAVDMTYKLNISEYLRKITDAAKDDLANKKELFVTATEEAAKTKSVLVVNFKTKIEPQLLFSIVTEKGEKIYDISMSKESRKSSPSLFFARKKGDAVIEKEQLEGEVLSVSAFKISGGEIVIKSGEAERIATELKKECFEEGKIVVISAE